MADRHAWLGVAAAASLFFPPLQEAPVPACVPARPEAADPRTEPLLDPAQREMALYLSRRFSVASLATERMVAAAHRAADEVGLDPLLVLAVISVESRFNPVAESVAGARGLMQIMPRYHGTKLSEFGGEDAVLDPESNILVGARILQEYVYRTGTLEAGLQSYNGARDDPTARYARRVLAERERLALASAAF